MINYRSLFMTFIFSVLCTLQAVADDLNDTSAEIDIGNGNEASSSICEIVPDGCKNNRDVFDAFKGEILFGNLSISSITVPDTEVVECRWKVPVRCEYRLKGMVFSKKCIAVGAPICEPEIDLL